MAQTITSLFSSVTVKGGSEVVFVLVVFVVLVVVGVGSVL